MTRLFQWYLILLTALSSRNAGEVVAAAHRGRKVGHRQRFAPDVCDQRAYAKRRGDGNRVSAAFLKRHCSGDRPAIRAVGKSQVDWDNEALPLVILAEADDGCRLRDAQLLTELFQRGGDTGDVAAGEQACMH